MAQRMNIVLLDTSVASLFHYKKRNSARRALFQPHVAGKIHAVSFQTVAELWKWALKSNWGEKEKERLDLFVKNFLVIPYDYELAKVWARVCSDCERQGRRLEAGDAWIAATAVHRGIPLLSDDKDFADLNLVGLSVVCFADREE